jgi:hypothetical protein
MVPPIRPREWVRSKTDPNRCGLVTQIRGHSALVRWLGDGKGRWFGKKALRACSPPRPLVLEGSLDARLHSRRSERDALLNWCEAGSVDLAFKSIHRLEDLEQIAEALGRTPPPFIHIICHGDHDNDGPYIRFAPRDLKRNRVYLRSSSCVDAFRRCFAGLSILFSACLIGKYASDIEHFRRAAGLKYVAAFCREIFDDEAILFDLALYHSSIVLGLTFPTAVERAREALDALRIRGLAGRSQKLIKVF